MDYHERTLLTSVREALGILGTLVGTLAPALFASRFGGEARGFSYLAVAVGGLTAVFIIVCFFSVRENPKITFESTKVAKKDANAFEVTGTLTYHGAEKEITFPAELIGAAETPMGQRAGLHAQITIQRTDYGDSKYVNEGALGDEVVLTISLEGIAQ